MLVDNAGAFVDWTETGTGARLDDAHRVMETNLFGAWRTTQALLPLLRASAHPRVVMVSSRAGSHGAEQMGARPVADGAVSVVWPALVPDDGPRGLPFRDRAPLAW